MSQSEPSRPVPGDPAAPDTALDTIIALMAAFLPLPIDLRVPERAADAQPATDAPPTGGELRRQRA